MSECNHCRRRGRIFARGLCWICWQDKRIRCRHSDLRVTDTMDAQQAPEPTDAIPGTERKLQILEQRAAQSLALFHPEDAKLVTLPDDVEQPWRPPADLGRPRKTGAADSYYSKLLDQGGRL